MPPSPSAQLLSLINGFQVSQAICVATRLGIPDLLSEGERDLAELAGATATHAPSLYRLLRALAAIGILSERPGGRFVLLPLGEPLQLRPSSSMWAPVGCVLNMDIGGTTRTIEVSVEPSLTIAPTGGART